MNTNNTLTNNSETHQCDFGCGQTASFQLKNGKWCCHKSYHHCPKFHNKILKRLQRNRDEGLIAKQKEYGTWKCEECDLIFETRQQLKNHNKLEHNHISAKSLKGKEKKFACPFCFKEYDTHQQICGHITNCPKHPNKNQHDLSHKKSGQTYSKKKKQGCYNLNNGFRKGSHHSLETKQKISIKRSAQVKNEYLNKFHAKVKWYKVKNIKGEEFSVRGHWEENVAKRLNELGIYWIKSPSIKYFKEYWHNYTPDLYIPFNDVYIEVKGRYPDTDREKMRLVVHQNPDKKIYFIHDDYHKFIDGKISFDDNLLIKEKDL